MTKASCKKIAIYSEHSVWPTALWQSKFLSSVRQLAIDRRPVISQSRLTF